MGRSPSSTRRTVATTPLLQPTTSSFMRQSERTVVGSCCSRTGELFPSTACSMDCADGPVDWGSCAANATAPSNRAITNLRDLVAHPTGYHLATPVDVARTLRDLAEIINHLWGAPTPGGRLYPAPIKREVVALAWDEGETQVHVGLASDLTGEQPPDKPWRCAIVREYTARVTDLHRPESLSGPDFQRLRRADSEQDRPRTLCGFKSLATHALHLSKLRASAFVSAFEGCPVGKPTHRGVCGRVNRITTPC